MFPGCRQVCPQTVHDSPRTKAHTPGVCQEGPWLALFSSISPENKGRGRTNDVFPHPRGINEQLAGLVGRGADERRVSSDPQNVPTLHTVATQEMTASSLHGRGHLLGPQSTGRRVSVSQYSGPPSLTNGSYYR